MTFRPPLMAIMIFGTTCSAVLAAKGMQFWNLTSGTIQHLYLAPAGSTHWGRDQCASDPDGTVDHDERLRLVGLTPGRYDVKLSDSLGRTCIVRNVEVHGNKAYAFSISEADLKDCTK